MMRRLVALALSVSAAAGCTGETESPAHLAPPESRLQALKSDLAQLRDDEDHQRALAVVRQMRDVDPQHPEVFISAVLLHARKQQFDEAEAFLSTLVDGGPGAPFGLGVLRFFEGRLDEAGTLLATALAGYDELGHAAGRATTHNFLGLVARQQGELDRAAREFRASMALNRQAGNTSAVASNLSNLGKIQWDRGEYAEALTLQREVLSIREQHGSPAEQGRIWQEIGRTLQRLSDAPGAIEAYEQALALRREIGDRRAQITSLQSLAGVRGELEDWTGADADFRQAISLADALGDRKRLATARYRLGGSLLSRGAFSEAADVLSAAVVDAGSAGDRRVESQASSSLGYAYSGQGLFLRAQEALERALRLAEELNDERLQADPATELASVFFRTGELASALAHQVRACEHYSRLGGSSVAAHCWLSLGAIYHRLGNLEQAERQLHRVMDVAGESALEHIARNNLGVVLMESGRVREAARTLQEAIRFCKTREDPLELAYAQLNAAEASWLLGQRDEASGLLRQAKSGFETHADRFGQASALNLNGRFLHESDKDAEAMTAYAEALALSREYGLKRQEWTGLAGRAEVLAATGRLEQARKEYGLALAIVEALRSGVETGELKMRFLAGKANLFERALELELRIDPSAVERTFELAERAKARSLLDLLAEARAGLRDRMSPELLERESEVLDQLSAAALRLSTAADPLVRSQARADLSDAETRLQEIRVQMRRSVPQYGQVIYPGAASLREIQTRVLDPEETLLSYFIGAELAMVWVVDRQSVRAHRLPHPDTIRAQVRSFLERTGKARMNLGNRRTGDDEAGALAASILTSEAPTSRRLLIAPDGLLHHVPFDALRRNGRYLVEDHEITVVPSATTASLLRETTTPVAAGGFLGLGDPGPGRGASDPAGLPHARQALGQISELFSDGPRQILAGEAFTKAALRQLPLDEFRYVHIATHGWLDSAHPGYFGLQLSPSEAGGDDVLYLHEVFSLRLAAELVVLSACRSGMGEMLRGEGLNSMTRAFLYAGSRALVVSLWNVDDQSTAEFMKTFYRGIRDGRTVPDALRQTKLSFIGSERPLRRQPHRWASFVLVGDPVRETRRTEPSDGTTD